MILEGDEFFEEDVTDTSEEHYFFQVFDKVSESVISDEYYDKNARLLSAISAMCFDINERSGKMPPELATKVIEGVFSNILKHGIR